MGLLLSRFRKKKTTAEQLDDIEQKIRSIEKFHKETEQKFRRVVGKLIVSSILIYAIALCGYYYYFSPDKFRENILSFVPLLVFPVVIILSRKILSWYYRRKLSKNESTLKLLKSSKKKILDEVMDKEVYKVAKEILEKYAPEQLNANSAKSVTSNGNSKALVYSSPQATPQSSTVTRQRLTSNIIARRPPSSALTPAPNMPAEMAPQPRLSLPRPVLPRNRGAFDKLVDMIIGDGPSNRYALICRVCSSHNGMALKHEFEYIAFRCAYCMQWNPARKQKPLAPHLALDGGSHDESDANNSEPEVAEVTASVVPAESFASDDNSDSSASNTTKAINEPTVSPLLTYEFAKQEAGDNDDDEDDDECEPKADAGIGAASDDAADLSALLRKAFDKMDIDDEDANNDNNDNDYGEDDDDDSNDARSTMLFDATAAERVESATPANEPTIITDTS